MSNSDRKPRVLVTGSAGFIGFHLARVLLRDGFEVHGYDGITDYYDRSLKERRHELLFQSDGFSATHGLLEDEDTLWRAAETAQADVIVHLAGQAGVRYSLEDPKSYVTSNVLGSFNVMEVARKLGVRHLLMASSSSVYGANEKMPFRETDKADEPLTIYAATKKATESMGHSYAHLWNLPTTMFRFFTVYGSWGRPDLAFFKFTEAILSGRPIDIYNHGEMFRDFTFVGDLALGIRLLIDAVPQRPASRSDITEGDSLSPVAPFRIVNVGNSEKVRLLDFIDALEDCLGVKANRRYLDMQKGDVPATWANADLLKSLTGFAPQTNIRDGLAEFVAWYRAYYGK